VRTFTHADYGPRTVRSSGENSADHRRVAATKGFNGGGIYDSNNDFGLDTNTIVLFAFCLAMAMLLSYAYIWLARAFTKQFIWITGIIHIIAGFATAIYMLSRRYWSGGIVFLLFSIFTVVCFISWIPRIPFSVVMLQTRYACSSSLESTVREY